MKLVQMEAVDVYRDYLYTELENGCVLYIGEYPNGLEIFMISGNDTSGFADFSRIIG
jgi:hypothetical protein